MDCAVVYTSAALSDLSEITAFIAADNANAAKALASRLVDLADSLQRMPERGRLVRGENDVRVLVLSPYLIFYRFVGGDKRVEVLRFWHGARDPNTLAL
ncbi:MAG: type II toxin-antitoxin system RelE/ParE family toxin [Chthoniobacterales bacterium]